MTQFANKTFSVSCSSGDVPEDELAKRWAETFGKKYLEERPGDAEGRAEVARTLASIDASAAAASRALNAGVDLYGFGCEGVDMMPIEDDDE